MGYGCWWRASHGLSQAHIVTAKGLMAFRCRGLASAAPLLLVAAISGCGKGEGGPNLVPAEGIVTLDGRPLANADVMFIPQGETAGQALFGRTDAQGRFHVGTPDGKRRGAAVGRYKVTIQKLVKPDGSDFIPDPNAGPMDTGGFRELLPPRYASEAETQLEAEVPPGGSRELRFDLQLRRS